MIKAHRTLEGKELIGVGLTVKDVNKLKSGAPLLINTTWVNIMLTYGLNDDTLRRDLSTAGFEVG